MVQLSLLYLYTGGLYLNKVNLLKIIKLSLGASLAIFIAWLLKLEYSMVAGVIVLLTIKNTKKETLKGIIGKIYGFILCTIFSYLCFNILGYHLTLIFSSFFFRYFRRRTVLLLHRALTRNSRCYCYVCSYFISLLLTRRNIF